MLHKLPNKYIITGFNVSLVLLGNSSNKCKDILWLLPKCNHRWPWWVWPFDTQWAHGIHIPPKDSSYPRSSRTDVQSQISQTSGREKHFTCVCQYYRTKTLTHLSRLLVYKMEIFLNSILKKCERCRWRVVTLWSHTKLSTFYEYGNTVIVFVSVSAMAMWMKKTAYHCSNNYTEYWRESC
jgi:hypothetical protein